MLLQCFPGQKDENDEVTEVTKIEAEESGKEDEDKDEASKEKTSNDSKKVSCYIFGKVWCW